MMAPLTLPQIALVGAQSAGKSSVLENLVGRDFLPRGPGVVTRRPLLLELRDSRPGAPEYGEFRHQRGRVYYDFHEIKREIEVETERIGGHGAISPAPIHLRLHVAGSAVSLNLIDLPGLARLASSGQPAGLEQQIEELIMHYIRAESCLILAVSPANQDLATSDALKLARQVDPSGGRTIGVLTKLDLMDAGTDASATLTDGGLLPLRRGYIGLVGGSASGMGVAGALERERLFFARHPAYSRLGARCGARALRETLERQLAEHIKASLPRLKLELERAVSSTKEAIRQDAELIGSAEPSHQMALLVKSVSQLARDYSRALFGRSAQVATSRLSAGARLARLFQDEFPLRIKPLSGDFERDSMAIENLAGVRGISEQAFEYLVRSRIESMRAPIMECIELVSNELNSQLDELLESTRDAILPGQQQAPVVLMAPHINLLWERLATLVREQLLRLERLTIEQMNLLVDVQLAYIHMADYGLAKNMMKHKDRESESSELALELQSDNNSGSNPSAALASSPSSKRSWFSFGLLSSSPSAGAPGAGSKATPAARADGRVASNRRFYGELNRLVNAYVDSTRVSLVDLSVKCCVHFLVESTGALIGGELSARLSLELSAQSVNEAPDPRPNLEPSRRSRSEQLRRRLEALDQALEVLNGGAASNFSFNLH